MKERMRHPLLHSKRSPSFRARTVRARGPRTVPGTWSRAARRPSASGETEGLRTPQTAALSRFGSTHPARGKWQV